MNVRNIFLVMALAAIVLNGNFQRVNAELCENANGGCPQGPYLNQGCRDCQLDENQNLQCRCLNENGGLQWSSVADSWVAAKCINNMNGDLTVRFPTGNYEKTCDKCAIAFNKLICDCKKNNGNVKRSEYDGVCDCKGTISNSNGVLSCTTAAPSQNPTMPPTYPPTSTTGSPTLQPTPAGGPTLPPTYPGGKCDWSSTIYNNDGNEIAPTKLCRDFANLQGCAYNNMCCMSNGACFPPLACTECPDLSQSNCNLNSRCCEWKNSRCQRKCLGVGTQVCASG